MALQLKNPGSGSNEYIDVPETRLDTAGIATINSGVLAPAEPINYATPNPVPLPDVTKLNAEVTPPLAPTEPETKAQDLTGRLQALNESLIGESAFKTQQETQQGIPGLLKTHTDLSSQLKAIQNEALAIPLQLQQEATGRGITAAGLAPIQTARLRTNAIQALGVSSLLEASRGNIMLAQDLVDRAVATKYDPIREEIAAKTKNLDLILKSPEFTVAEKNRAQAQLARQKAQERVIAKQEEDSKTISSWAAAALANGATQRQAQEIMNIAQSDMPNLYTAFALFAPFARNPQELEKAIADLESQRVEDDYKKSQSAVNWANVNKIKNPTPDVPTVKTINGVDMQWNPDSGKWETIGGGMNSTTEKTVSQLDFLQDTADDALKYASAAGRSGGRRMFESFVVGSTDYTKLEAVANTLKVNVLSLMTDPNIKKFFGPQMSNADVTLMTSAGTTMNPELTSPDMMIGEINRLKDLFTRMQNSLSGAQNILTSPDGSQYVSISDLSPQEIDEARKAGWK